jgi:hypothetical protein
MDYRGKHFTILQGIEPDSWKWSVSLDENKVKTGEAPVTRGRNELRRLVNRPGAEAQKGEADPARKLGACFGIARAASADIASRRAWFIPAEL